MGHGGRGTGVVWRVARWREAGGDGGGADDGCSWNLHQLTAALPEVQPHFQSFVKAKEMQIIRAAIGQNVLRITGAAQIQHFIH